MILRSKYFTFPKSMLFVVLFLTVGCAPVISKQIRDQARTDVTFRDVLNDPELYKGQMIIFSGVIIEARNTAEGTLLQVLQRPAGFRGRPKEVDETGGRFLAIDNRYLDVYVYEKGRDVTIAGEVLGKKILPLDKTEYVYPLIQVKEIYLWPVIEKGYYVPYPYPYYYYDDYWWWQSHLSPRRKHHRHRKNRKQSQGMLKLQTVSSLVWLQPCLLQSLAMYPPSPSSTLGK